MEQEFDKKPFNFNKAIEKPVQVIEPMFDAQMKKRLKITSFLLIAGIGIGIGLGLTSTLLGNYRASHESNLRIEEMQAKNNEATRIAKLNIDSNLAIKKAAAEEKALALKKTEEEKLFLESEKYQYSIWEKNRDDIIKNYDEQLNIYDKAYENVFANVKAGLLSIPQLEKVREQYQAYKNSINVYTNFVLSSTKSFETFTSLSNDDRSILHNEILNYQNGSLHRSTELENALKDAMINSSQDRKDETILKLRKKANNQVIDDLAEIMSNQNNTTKTKKLK